MSDLYIQYFDLDCFERYKMLCLISYIVRSLKDAGHVCTYEHIIGKLSTGLPEDVTHGIGALSAALTSDVDIIPTFGISDITGEVRRLLSTFMPF